MLGAEEIGVLNTGQYVFLNLGNFNISPKIIQIKE